MNSPTAKTANATDKQLWKLLCTVYEDPHFQAVCTAVIPHEADAVAWLNRYHGTHITLLSDLSKSEASTLITKLTN